MSKPAAYVGSEASCPAHHLVVPATGPGAQQVNINGSAALRSGDGATPCGALAASGSLRVFVEKRQLMRVGDLTSHSGAVLIGSFNVNVGDPESDRAYFASHTPPECKYLQTWDADRGPNGPGYDAAENTIGRFRSTDATVSAPASTEYQFRSDKPPEPALKYHAHVRGRDVVILSPASGAPAGTWLPTADNVAASLASLPDSALDGTKTVVVTPYPLLNPDGTEDPTALAWTDQGDGRITYGTRDKPKSQGDLDWVFMHEGGHIVGSPDNWAAVMKSDGDGVSKYGDSNSAEDYAESVLMYAMTVGTICEGTARRLFPNRYAALDQRYAGQFVRRGG